MIDHLYISFLLFLMAGFIGLLIVGTKIELWRKLAIMVLLVVSSISSYRALFTFYGQPKVIKASFNEVLIISSYIDKANNKIYIWVKDGKELPVSFQLPYSENLAKKLENEKRRRFGTPFMARIKTELKEGNPYRDTVEEIEIEVLPMYPSKTNKL